MKSVFSLYQSLNNRLKTHICELKDFQTTRHIVVFESDDWGSIRMPNKKAWDELLRLGYAVDKRPYERFDTLESPEDLEALFGVLSKYKDSNGNHPVITANMLMANPDFEKIKKSNYQEYYFEPISNTYNRYYGNAKVLDLMRQGIDEGIFIPQSHGREHFNVTQWMKGLQSGDEDLLIAFKFGMCGIAPKAHPEEGNKLMNALLAGDDEEQKRIDAIVAEGLGMFKDLWGFQSKTFVAPCYLWNEKTEKVLAANRVKLIQTSRKSKPFYKSPSRYFYSGRQNKLGMVYSIRNCQFEPATNEDSKNVDVLMKQIDSSFAQNKIAVFSTHRINYVSGIDKKNQIRTSRVLDEFLTQLLCNYPDVEFMSSDKLIDILS